MTFKTTDPVTFPFAAGATAMEVTDVVDLSGKRAIVTGGASGIGVETTRTLLRRGARVTVTARDVATAATVIAAAVPDDSDRVDVRPLDLSDAASVRTFVEAWDGPVDLLINNAGVMALPERILSPEGWEGQLATNYLGHFRLTHGLRGALAAANGARVVSLSSSGHLFSPIVFDDLNFSFRPYDPQQAYAQSKTAVNLFAVEASARWADDGITINAVNPGAIATPLQRHVGGKLATPVGLQKTTEQGASTTMLVATSALLDGIGGRYFNDNQQAIPVTARPDDIPTLVASVAAYSLDRTNAERLWSLTLPLL